MTSSTQPQCCIQCWRKQDDLLGIKKSHCINSSCECHREQPRQEWEEWEIQFGVKFVVRNTSSKSGLWWKVPLKNEKEIADPDTVRAFISTTLASERKALLEELLREIDDECAIECKGHDIEGTLVKFSHCSECGVRSAKSLIEKKLKI